MPSVRWSARFIPPVAATLVALTCVDADGQLLMPCGRCRQVLLEHGGPGLLIDHASGPRLLSELLPDAFGPDDLARISRKDQTQ